MNQSESDEISVRNQPLGSASHSSTLSSSERWLTAISPPFTWNICREKTSSSASSTILRGKRQSKLLVTVSDNRFLPAVYVCLFPVPTKQGHPAQSWLWRTGFHSLGARFYQQQAVNKALILHKLIRLDVTEQHLESCFRFTESRIKALLAVFGLNHLQFDYRYPYSDWARRKTVTMGLPGSSFKPDVDLGWSEFTRSYGGKLFTEQNWGSGLEIISIR